MGSTYIIESTHSVNGVQKKKKSLNDYYIFRHNETSIANKIAAGA
ncbi:MAG: hypothetical protein ACI32Z_07465 [Clostridium sp.]